jgi:hypothetical protein
MASTIVSLALALAAGTSAWPGNGYSRDHSSHPLRHDGGRILVDGPGNGYGFPNGNPDGYGWVDYGTALPLGANRTAEYYFPRYHAVPPAQAFMPGYYNPYVTRGQRYLAYSGCGGAHPAGGFPTGSARTPVHPYQDTIGTGPRVSPPAFSGAVEAVPIQSGGTGLTP